MYAYFDSVRFYKLISTYKRDSTKENTSYQNDTDPNDDSDLALSSFFEQLICNIESKQLQFEDIESSEITDADLKSLYPGVSEKEIQQFISNIISKSDNDDDSCTTNAFTFTQFKSYCNGLKRNNRKQILECIYYCDILPLSTKDEVRQYLYKSKNYESYKSNEYKKVLCDY